MERAKFGYWGIRGLGQPIRYVMEYYDFPYEERRYDFKHENNFSREEWLSEKFTLGLDFPNLPYLILKNGTKLTQSLAILRYIARVTETLPKNLEDQIRADLCEQQVNELLWANVRLCYNPEYTTEKKEAFVEDFLKVKIKQLDSFLGNRNFFASDDAPTYVDFLTYEMLDQFCTLFPEYEAPYKESSNIEKFYKRMEELPKFKKFLESDRFLRWPVWSEAASYGGPKMNPPDKNPIKY